MKLHLQLKKIIEWNYLFLLLFLQLVTLSPCCIGFNTPNCSNTAVGTHLTEGNIFLPKALEPIASFAQAVQSAPAVREKTWLPSESKALLKTFCFTYLSFALKYLHDLEAWLPARSILFLSTSFLSFKAFQAHWSTVHRELPLWFSPFSHHKGLSNTALPHRSTCQLGAPTSVLPKAILTSAQSQHLRLCKVVLV